VPVVYRHRQSESQGKAKAKSKRRAGRRNNNANASGRLADSLAVRKDRALDDKVGGAGEQAWQTQGATSDGTSDQRHAELIAGEPIVLYSTDALGFGCDDRAHATAPKSISGRGPTNANDQRRNAMLAAQRAREAERSLLGGGSVMADGQDFVALDMRSEDALELRSPAAGHNQGRDTFVSDADSDKRTLEASDAASPRTSGRQSLLTVPLRIKSIRTSIAMHAYPFAAPLVLKARPYFIVCQVVATIMLWLLSETVELTFLSGFRDDTDLRVAVDCNDYRLQCWRWLTYQLHHTSAEHVLMNAAVLVFGVPLERFHGSVRMCLMFNAGVLGGAACYFVWDNHRRVVGMSAGCCALLGLYFADLILNWRAKDWKSIELLTMGLFLVVSLVEAWVFSANDNTSHSAHLGGLVAGVLIGFVVGRVVGNRTWRMTAVKLVALAVGLLLALFSFSWLLQWPPRTWRDPQPWCWTRQIWNESFFGDKEWHCVRCGNEMCIDRWSRMSFIAPPSVECFRKQT